MTEAKAVVMVPFGGCVMTSGAFRVDDRWWLRSGSQGGRLRARRQRVPL